MQIASAQPTEPLRRPTAGPDRGRAWQSGGMSGADPRFAQYKVIRRNGSVVAFEPSKITIAMTKAFLAINGGQGAASARVREEVDEAHRRRRRGVGQAQARGRRDPHRGNPGPGRAAADARRRARSRARLRAVSREALAGARARQGQGQGQAAEHAINVIDNGVKKPLDLDRLTRARQGIVRGPGRRRARPHPQGHAEGPLRRRGRGRSAQGRGAVRARADREGSRVLVRHRAPAARRAALRSAGRGSHASATWRPSTPSTSRAS